MVCFSSYIFKIDGHGESKEENSRRVVRSIEQSRRSLKYFYFSYVYYRNDPMGKACRICGTQIEHWANYCTSCAFKKGICARCGRKVQETKFSHMYDK